MIIDKKLLYIVFIIFSILSMYAFGLHRYAVYLSMLGALSFIKTEIKTSWSFLGFLFFLFLIFALQLGTSHNGGGVIYYFGRDLFFIVLPIVVVLLLKGAIYTQEKAEIYILRGIILIGVFVFAKRMGSVGSFNIVENFISSHSTLETPSAPLYAIGGITALICKRRKEFLILSLFCILASKRIVTAGYVVVLIMHVLKIYKWYSRKFLKFTFISIALFVNFGVVYMMYMLGNGAFDDIIYLYTQLPTQSFTAGRSVVYGFVFDLTPVRTLYIGNGIGYAPYLLHGKLSSIGLDLLHSDVLRLFIEMGFVLFAALIITLYRSVKGKMIYLLVLMNFFLLTDNYIIYAEVMFVFYICILLVDNYQKRNYAK